MADERKQDAVIEARLAKLARRLDVARRIADHEESDGDSKIIIRSNLSRAVH